MRDPYQILGIPRSATDDEVKKAYYKLARQYHPDNFASGSAQAAGSEEKMKEINEAYDMIQKERQGRGDSSSEYNSYSSSGTTNFYTIRTYMNQGRYSEAEYLINSTPASDRGAEWNFLKGCLLVHRGYYYDAMRFIEIACYMDPGNREYAEAKSRLQQRSANFGSTYRTSQGTATGGPDLCTLCSTLLCADTCCECFGGDIIRCC